MEFCYVVAGTEFIRPFGEGGISVSVPAGSRGNVTLRVLRSGKVNALVGKGGELTLSLIDDSLGEGHSLGIALEIGNGGTAVCTLNSRPASTGARFSMEVDVGENGLAKLNVICEPKSGSLGEISAVCGERSKLEANMLMLPPADGSAGLEVSVLHRGHGSASSMECAGIARGRSVCKFRGAVDVPSGVDNAVPRMRGVFITSEDARVSAEPVMRIHSRETSASHGISIGGPGPEQIAYMMSRGISADDAHGAYESGLVSVMLNKMAAPLKPQNDAVSGHKDASLPLTKPKNGYGWNTAQKHKP